MIQLTSDLGVAPIAINSAKHNPSLLGEYPGRVPTERKGILLSGIIGTHDYVWRYLRGNFNRTALGNITKPPTLTTSNWKHNFRIGRSGGLEYFTAEHAE